MRGRVRGKIRPGWRMPPGSAAKRSRMTRAQWSRCLPKSTPTRLLCDKSIAFSSRRNDRAQLGVKPGVGVKATHEANTLRTKHAEGGLDETTLIFRLVPRQRHGRAFFG